ncbi:MAG: transcription elongation GreA/GreB family factor [Oleispira sp.]
MPIFWLLVLGGVMKNHLSLVRIVEDFKNKSTRNINRVYQAQIGSKIKLLDKQTFTSSRITLTEPDDSDPNSGKVSYLSALGSELLGSVSGQNISVDVFGRIIDFQVLSIINTQPPKGGNH